jgi:hypothetical protein
LGSAASDYSLGFARIDLSRAYSGLATLAQIFRSQEAPMTKARKRKSPRSLAELSTLDDFLKEEGKLEEFQAIAIKEVLDWQIAKGIRPAKARSPN